MSVSVRSFCSVCVENPFLCHRAQSERTYSPMFFNKDVTISELEAKIKLQDQRIENLLKVGRYYASEIYVPEADYSPNFLNCLPVEDIERMEGYKMGGKLAREALARDKELTEEK